MADNQLIIPDGYKEVFCRYIHKKGRIIYPTKAKFFRFLVPIGK